MKSKKKEMKLTSEILEKGKSSNGAWSAKQMKLFGLSFPLEPGWKTRILGCDFPVEDIEKFVNLKDAHLKDGKNSFQQKLEQERKRALNWRREEIARKTRSYEPPTMQLIVDCPFEITQGYIDNLIRYGKTDRSYSIVTDTDFLEHDAWSSPMRMDLLD